MYSIELMVEEHENILKLLEVIRKASCEILEGADLDIGDFRKIIAFARNYADRHHHGKEEKILFKEMSQHLGQIGVNLIQNGMLVEHELGRLHIAELEKALDNYEKEPKTLYKLAIMTESNGYANLLHRHIDKENQVIYTYAEKNLQHELLQSVDQRVKSFEAEAKQHNVQERELAELHALTAKYGVYERSI